MVDVLTKSALIVHTGGGLGDVLLSGPVIDTLANAGFRVDYLARSSTAHALRGHPSLNELLTIDSKDPNNLKEMRSWADTLKQRQYDIVFLLWSTTRWAWTLYLAGIPKRVGQDSRLMYSFLFTHRVSIRSEKGDETSHWTDILLDYPRKVGIEALPARLVYQVEAEAKAQAKNLLKHANFGTQTGPLLGFHSGKGLDLTPDRWPVDHFSTLARALQDSLGARIVLTGGPNEIELIEHVSRPLTKPYLNLAGKTNLQVLAAIIQECDAFICPDSGPMHIAAAVKTPVVGIYALDEDFPSRWAPFGTPHKIIRPTRPACPPGCKKPDCPNFACYLKVKPDALSLATSELIGEVRRDRIQESCEDLT